MTPAAPAAPAAPDAPGFPPLVEFVHWPPPSVAGSTPFDGPVSASIPVDGVWRFTAGGSPREASPLLVDGLRSVVEDAGAAFPWTLARGEDGGWLVSIPLSPAARVFGGGESFQGPDLRGRQRKLVNVEAFGVSDEDRSYLNVPLLWSTDGWGVLVHTGGPVRADVGGVHSETLVLEVEDEVLDVFVLGGAPAEILGQYHALTGLPGRFPAWGLGIWTSRCSYMSEDEINEILDGYQAADCPVDVVHVDAWIEGNVIVDLACNWRVDRARFPEGWVARLGGRGVRVSLWHNSYVVKGSDRAAELEGLGLLVPDAVTADKDDRFIIDFTNPAAVAWWQDRVRETVASEGNHAFKPDFAEELPEGAVLFDGRPSRTARNEYSVLYQAATHGAMAELSDEVALFCRSGTLGAQRYPCHWVGDTPSTWPGLVTALRACLSLSLSGFGFVSHDVGGFWTGGSHSWIAEAFQSMDGSSIPADVEPELFARWTQWGALSPVMRFHGTGRREPWAYPAPWGDIAVAACRLRAALRPDLERAAAEASTEGTPMMRPMALAYPSFPEAAGELQYLLGDDLLVAPLLEAGGRRRVWVPPGSWTGVMGLAPVEGPAWVEVACSPEQFPVWRRA